MKILIVGGYGTFGGRLVDLLAEDARLQIYVAGRNATKARNFVALRKVSAKLEALAFDRAGNGELLKKLKPGLVVDASGPFQVYGSDPYELVQACIAAGCNYIDLADGAAFVEGISVFDEQAKAAGVFVLSGMSSFPVLTAAVVRHLAKDMAVVDTIQAGIAPSPYAGVGLNVIRAIASYSGKPVDVLQKGVWVKRTGFWDSRYMVVNVPGEIPLRPIRFALTEVPDLKVLSWERPEAKSIWMGAGPTPALMHRLLWLAAGLVKIGVLRSLLPIASVMNWVVNTIRWGEHRGGMIVEVVGSGKKRSWHLLAEGEGGPLIPSMAAEAMVLRVHAGRTPESGARSGHRDLELEDYAPLFISHKIKTGLRQEKDAPIYEVVMGESFFRLAAPIQAVHNKFSPFVMRGKADVSGSDGLLARLVRKLFGFPSIAKGTAVQVSFDFIGRREIWNRQFGIFKFKSEQFVGKGRYLGLIMEKFGPFSFGMAVLERDGALELKIRSGDFLGIPIPRFLLPSPIAREHAADGRFNFEVEINLPLAGQIVKYQGWLEPV